MKHGYADTSHGQIHYIEDGSGEPILMLHMTPSSSWDYALALPLLGMKYHAIAMDTLGYGYSDKTRHIYEIEHYGKSVVEFLDVMGIEKVTLAGHATGSVIAGEVAASHPLRVNKLVFVDYPLYNQSMLEERKKSKSYIPNVEPLELKSDGSYMISTLDYARTFLGGTAPIKELHEMAVSVFLGGSRNAEAHEALWRYLDRGEPIKKLPLVKCPTLVLSCLRITEFRARRFDSSVPDSNVKEILDLQLRQLEDLIPHRKVMVIGKDVPAPLLSRVSPGVLSDAIISFMENPDKS
jgi:pimeloyl-ACP methyl ester carboxylesterase